MTAKIPTHGLPRNIRRYSGESINFADRFADLDIVWEEVVSIGIYGRHEDMFTVFPAISSTKAAPKLQGVPMVVYGHTFRIELQSWQQGKPPNITVYNESDRRITLTIRLSDVHMRKRIEGQDGAHIIDRMGAQVSSKGRVDTPTGSS